MKKMLLFSLLLISSLAKANDNEIKDLEFYSKPNNNKVEFIKGYICFNQCNIFLIQCDGSLITYNEEAIADKFLGVRRQAYIGGNPWRFLKSDNAEYRLIKKYCQK
jgi:hypothetical protein